MRNIVTLCKQRQKLRDAFVAPNHYVAGWIEGSANRATFANDESRPGSQSPQDWHVISPFYFTALPLLPFTIPLTQSRPHQTNYLNCLGESNGRTFRP